jgi:hypothetical protein
LFEDRTRQQAAMKDPLEDLYEILSIHDFVITNEIKAIKDPFDQVVAIIQRMEDLTGEQVIELKAHVRDLAGLFLELDDDTDLLDKAEKVLWGTPILGVDPDE